MKQFPQKQTILLLSILYFGLGILLSYFISTWVWQSKLSEFVRVSHNKQAFYTTYLQGLLEKTENIPPLLANNEKLIHILRLPSEYATEEINIFLESIVNISDTSDIYLLNDQGITIAASNWKKPYSFVGKDFSFRPYFTSAIAGKQGRYYAMGTTSSKRGYYFSYPILHQNSIIGVVVVKTDIELVEKNWNHLNDSILITDPDGIIFLTTKPIWLYNSVTPLSKDDQERIAKSRRYPINSFEPISQEIEKKAGQNFLHIPDTHGEIVLLQQKVSMPHAGWDVHILTDMAPAKRLQFMAATLSFICFTFIYIVASLLIQRYERQQHIIRIKEVNRKELEAINAQLEVRVNQRTDQLLQSNTLLQHTKNELTHAAKMAALGQISAQINHELNQPLAAIRSYADNAQLFLNHNRIEETRSNLHQISALTERMAQTGKQLKLFSRKSSGEISPVALSAVLDGTLAVLQPSLSKNLVQLHSTIEPVNAQVMANSVLLQQVLVNLFVNAMDAMETSGTKEIIFKAKQSGKDTIITVCDTGPGIDEELRAHILEPFFTTKKSGNGLGLGLTISDRIIEEFGGKLRLQEGSQTCFTFTLGTYNNE